MKKLLISIIIILLLIPSVSFAADYSSLKTDDMGDQVSILQTWLRWQGYFNYRTTGRYSDLTEDAVKKFQAANGLEKTGIADSETQKLLFSGKSKPASKNKNFISVYGPRLIYPTEFGETIEWENADSVFSLGTTATIYDLYSDTSFSVTRTGGINNAEIEFSSETDADKFIEMCGGSSTWEKRPVKISIGDKLYACSIFCSLNKTESQTGKTRIYFTGSKSDIFNIEDAEMNTAVLKASGAIAS